MVHASHMCVRHPSSPWRQVLALKLQSLLLLSMIVLLWGSKTSLLRLSWGNKIYPLRKKPFLWCWLEAGLGFHHRGEVVAIGNNGCLLSLLLSVSDLLDVSLLCVWRLRALIHPMRLVQTTGEVGISATTQWMACHSSKRAPEPSAMENQAINGDAFKFDEKTPFCELILCLQTMPL